MHPPDLHGFELELWRSMHERHELWGTTMQFGPGGGNIGTISQLVNFNLPSWCARTFTVNLVSMRYTGGTVLGPLAGALLWPPAGAPPTASLTPDNTNFDVVDCILNYGVGGIGEQGVILDYPANGCSFEVTCSTLQVQLRQNAVFPSSANLQPTFGVFVTPSGKTSNSNQGYNGAIYTAKSGATTSFTLATGGKAQVIVPRRARSYTIFFGGNVFSGPVSGLRIQQMDAAGFTEYRRDLEAIDTTDVGSEDGALVLTGGAWQPMLDPNAQSLVITNTTPVVPCTMGVRFNLDLG